MYFFIYGMESGRHLASWALLHRKPKKIGKKQTRFFINIWIFDQLKELKKSDYNFMYFLNKEESTILLNLKVF